MLSILYQHFKYTRILKRIYKSENIIGNLSNLFGANFKLDWSGRLYAVLNPYLKDGKFDPTSITMQYDEDGVSDNVFIENWIMERMLVAQQFIQANNLFDLLTYDIKNLGSGNYLFVIKSITFNDFVKNIKLLSILTLVIIICTTLILYLT